MIRVEGLYKSFGDTEILKDVNMQFEPGKINMIIGQSGSGKSVLTKCIVGVYEPTEGSVFYDQNEFHSLGQDDKKVIRQELGMLFQGSALFDSKTVLENVMFPLEMFTKMNKEERKERAHFCLKRVQIEGKDGLYPAELSGGMQKRVGIARAIALNPKYLFCDEPNSGLDPKTSIVIDELIQSITAEFNITTVVISHDMNSVLQISDKIFFINKGQKWWEGSKDDILHSSNQELNDFVYASKFMKTVRERLN